MIWKRANEVQIAKIRATAAIDERFSSRVMIHKTRSSSKHKRGSNMILITKLGRNNLETMGASSIRSNDERENVELNSNLERLFAARALHGDIYWKIFLQRVEILLNGANGKEGFSPSLPKTRT